MQLTRYGTGSLLLYCEPALGGPKGQVIIACSAVKAPISYSPVNNHMDLPLCLLSNGYSVCEPQYFSAILSMQRDPSFDTKIATCMGAMRNNYGSLRNNYGSLNRTTDDFLQIFVYDPINQRVVE